MKEKLGAIIAFLATCLFVFEGLTFPDEASIKSNAVTVIASPVRFTRAQAELQFRQGQQIYNVRCDLSGKLCEPGFHGSGEPIELKLVRIGILGNHLATGSVINGVQTDYSIAVLEAIPRAKRWVWIYAFSIAAVFAWYLRSVLRAAAQSKTGTRGRR